MTLMREKKLDPQKAMPFLVLAAGPAPRDAEAEVDPFAFAPERTKALPAGSRAEVIEVLGRIFDDKREFENLELALEELPEWLARDIRKPLEKLLKHPSY